MNITLCSCFRNSTGYLDRYFAQTEALALLLYQRGDWLTLVLGYGDSTDDTDELLFDAAAGSTGAILVDCTHGGAAIGSVVSAERFKQLAHCGNQVLAAIPKTADVVLWVESDLLWLPETMLTLVDHLDKYPAVCPLVLLDRAGWAKNSFYDTWAARIGGVHFEHRYPYHKGFDPKKPFKVDSMGSCIAMRADIAREVNFPDEDVFVGLCAQIYANGDSLWLDPAVSVTHL